MRDDSQKWHLSQRGNKAALETNRAKISVVSAKKLTLISGPVERALTLCGCDRAIGWPEATPRESYALRLRRDRLLVVDWPTMDDGWNDELGLAISDMSGAYGVLEVEGQGALALLQMGTELDPNIPSASVARAFHGYPVLLYRADEKRPIYRLHVPSALLDGLFSLLSEFARGCE